MKVNPAGSWNTLSLVHLAGTKKSKKGKEDDDEKKAKWWWECVGGETVLFHVFLGAWRLCMALLRHELHTSDCYPLSNGYRVSLRHHSLSKLQPIWLAIIYIHANMIVYISIYIYIYIIVYTPACVCFYTGHWLFPRRINQMWHAEPSCVILLRMLFDETQQLLAHACKAFHNMKECVHNLKEGGARRLPVCVHIHLYMYICAYIHALGNQSLYDIQVYKGKPSFENEIAAWCATGPPTVAALVASYLAAWQVAVLLYSL